MLTSSVVPLSFFSFISGVLSVSVSPVWLTSLAASVYENTTQLTKHHHVTVTICCRVFPHLAATTTGC